VIGGRDRPLRRVGPSDPLEQRRRLIRGEHATDRLARHFGRGCLVDFVRAYEAISEAMYFRGSMDDVRLGSKQTSPF